MTTKNLTHFSRKINTSTVFGRVESVTISTAIIDSDGEKFPIKINRFQVEGFQRAQRMGAEIAVRCVDRSTTRAIGGRAIFTIEKEAEAIEFFNDSVCESFELTA